MTFSTLKPLSDAERAAWAAQNAFEDAERLARYRPMPFIEKLRGLESRGRELALFRERALAQRSKPQK